uniref:non-specific serine/threonine protein kinase n=1 Tax=Brassica oleracea var. oleracea TaxID=109376 RepID=A0A0D3DXZ2_BRAOL
MVILLNRRCFLVLILLTAFSCFSVRFCFGQDRITLSTPIKDSETLLCSNGMFRFGFFTPLNSTTRLRYVGIWYDKVPVQTVVWVANKDAPINDTSGVVSISEDGNLVVTDGRSRLLWSTNITVPPVATNATWVQLMDTGNLRLQDNGEILWESFKHPYNSFLPVMTFGINNRTGENLNLTSWRSYTDPSTGNYTAGISLLPFPQIIIWKRNVTIWRSGPWNGQIFIGLPDSISLLFLDGFNVSNDNQGTFLISYATDSFMHHFNLDPDGALYMRSWNTSTRAWTVDAIIPSTTCDAYNRCGPFASCGLQEVPPCKCVKGYVPRNSTEWNRGIFTSECVRRVPLKCNVSTGGGGKGDGFYKMQKMKLPANVEKSVANEKDCPKVCLDNCSCTAYAYDRGIGCLLWSGDLVDMQSLLGSGIDLYIRVSHSEFKTHSKRTVVITASVLGVVFVAAVCVLLACRKFKKRPAAEGDRSAELLFQRMEELTSGNESASNQVKLKDLPLFEFEVLATSTDNFSLRNKLGQGGFGPVYKGVLSEGKEIAVKRLSRASGQGLEELLNEVVVISKLQHRNLVKLLGCCIEDPLKQNILDWKTRFNIMEGICRGLLYLHRDSRLKIIHRDLKASNILLDENLNPKISDFGLARVFQVNEDEANTRRVVGTYGYMSPEYAMEGFFSEKSDVFSLGVIFLEIISGKKNSHKEDNNLNLLAYAWKLWNDGETASLADPTIFDECFEKEITKCVQIGLLCVQEVASDRPNVSTMIWMLTTENTNLPKPKQPAFIATRRVFEAESSGQSSQKVSINDSELEHHHRFLFWVALRYLIRSLLQLCFGEDRITFSTPIKDSETLLCSNGMFRFGFFTPVNSTGHLRYVGIWYDKVPVQTVVWVANKDTPINDTSGVVSISQDGNLVVTDGRDRIAWSTNVTVPVAPNPTWVQLMDNGNLVLQENRNNGETLWESFKHPYNSFLPRMTLGTNNRTGENLKLTSWRSYADPSTGNYTAGISLFPFPELMIWKSDVPIWRSGPWNEVGVLLPELGRPVTTIPTTPCDEYGRCGPFASCSLKEVPTCNCIKGFVPRNNTDRNERNGGSGSSECVRRVPLKCNESNGVGGGGGGKRDGFSKMQKMKVPANAEKALATEKDCPKVCLDNCSCTAYAYDRGIGCMLWSGDLVDMQLFLASGIDLHIRVAHSERDIVETHNKRAIMITATVLGVAFGALVCVLLACRKFKKRPAPEKDTSAELLFRRMEELTSDNQSASNQVKLKELPLFEFKVLATATDNFSPGNKLGQGGFGPVYKGELPEGQEIAVKRLSRASGQGLEELLNEVVVISKLQHRNLVKLLGCCIEGEERLLVYEYMPKKSLDAFLFDPLKQKILDWRTRFNIMEGICRGLLYLHRDSRLKIIHRDLKASNILLDDNLNPKISDFGLARVFQVNEDEANTRRVVGTYGYMSPEYAMEGFFSEKSDVFSLGVLFLEIISGRKNSHKEDNNLNLLAYAWKLWNDGETASLADPTIFDECFEKEITKCVQIGLLCVQEVASDRPNVSTMIWMLTTENTNLPEPKQPAFIARRRVFEDESSDQSSQKVSINDLCFGQDSITFSTPVKDSETLLCKNGIFRFGFFTPVNSTGHLRYVGIWYAKVPVQTVVWVANKDAPIHDTSGVISISGKGNLVVKDGLNRLIWSTNVTLPLAPIPNATWVQLTDNGNLRLQENRNKGEILWESFKHPYNSFLAKMIIGTSNRTGENLKLTSWRSYTDPSTGNYTAGISLFPFRELMIWKSNVTIWRSGPWNGQIFVGLEDEVALLFLDGYNIISDNNEGTFTVSYATDSPMYHMNLDPDGLLYIRSWSTSKRAWEIGNTIPTTTCDVYGRCGPFASCSVKEVPVCKCVNGFVPRNSTEWNRGIFTNGCARRVPLKCNVSGGGNGDGFSKMQKMKVPANAEQTLANEEACPKVCLDNCSCTAYAYDQGIGCMLWSGNLVDMQSSLRSGIVDLNIRVANSHSDREKTHSNRAIMITASVLGVAFVAVVCILLACRKFKKRSAPEKDTSAEIMFKRMEALTIVNESAPNQGNLKDLPLFEFKVLAASTDNFSLINKLGQGGFGPVYKGMLPEGKEIAVKRLSRASGQGLEELMNEVVVISKLQHRNLVKLLGCCIEGEERLLVYEYMPKKSLDAYLFDPLKQKILDWRTRFNIMEGICRGLLYLHRDSRLKIIHRDLKASNILLDDNLNPKISDFGLARVFQVNEDEANTRRVVGTYGYMSPEYAMEGLFSEKSDVFSLGVLFLEIISGRKNSHKEENNLNLLAYAWKLWNEGEAASLADPIVLDESFVKEITKCVHIGLLCVQEIANDRPSVSTVIGMLTTEITNLPEPKQPAFIARGGVYEAECSDQSSQKVSINDVSLTTVAGR